LPISNQRPEFVSEITQTPMVTENPLASESEKKSVFDLFKEKSGSVDDLKGKMLTQFPGLDSRTMTKLQCNQLVDWLKSL